MTKTTVESTLLRPIRSTSAGESPSSPIRDWVQSPMAVRAVRGLSSSAERWIARAPGRLEIMGGSAAHTGTPFLTQPISEDACVAVQKRSDPTVEVLIADETRDVPPISVCSISQERLQRDVNILDMTGQPRTESLRGLGRLVGCMLGAVAELIRTVSGIPGDAGLTLSLATTLGDLTEVGAPAATTAATILAAAAALGIRLDSELATTMGARAESNRGRYFSVSPDMVVALHGQPSVLTRIMDGSPVPEDPVRLPSGVQFLGIDFGTRQEDAESRFDHARTCAAIGQVLIDRILRHESPDVRQVKGRPTPVSVADYVEKVRDRIPTKLKGADFLALYPDARSLIPSLDPAGVYKVRSRTEHPIYEFARCRQFLECLHRACRNGDMEALIQAGELMYSSHWSYGQRCALGSAEADFVVSHLRRLGPQSGIFGAKMSGIGCGGVVVVFARSKEKSEAAIESTLQLHEKKFGRKARALFDSSPGGWLTGARRV